MKEADFIIKLKKAKDYFDQKKFNKSLDLLNEIKKNASTVKEVEEVVKKTKKKRAKNK